MTDGNAQHPSSTAPVVIIGGGLSGLTCALLLQRAGQPYLLLDANAQWGGRVRSERKNGFILDHGFQVYLTAYETAGRYLKLPELELQEFLPGAWVRCATDGSSQGQTRRLADPLRQPERLLETAFSPLMTLGDKWRVFRLKQLLMRKSVQAIWSSPELVTREYLLKAGFSEHSLTHFFRPFFSGIFLESQLETSSRMFEFVFKHFSLGGAALPKQGMQAIPDQLVAQLTPSALQLNTRVSQVTLQPNPSVTLANGQVVEAAHIILATDAHEAQRLLPQLSLPASNSVSTLYFEAPESPLKSPILWLNANPDEGPINHLCVLSDVQPSYAPPDKALISASILSDINGDVLRAAELQLSRVFGPETSTWTLLQSDTIRAALPRFTPDQNPLSPKPQSFNASLTLCGDYCTSPSIEGAMVSGEQAANTVLEALGLLQNSTPAALTT